MFSKIKKAMNTFNFKRRVGSKKDIIIDNNVSVRGLPNIQYGKNCHIYSNVILWGDGELILGDNVSIGDNTIIKTTKGAGIWIGSNSLIAANSYLVDCNHRYKDKNKLIRNQGFDINPIKIGEDNWIGANCTICAGADLGQHVIVAANAVVLKGKVKSNSIIGGVPARIIKELD